MESMIQAETFALAADVTDHPNPYIGAQVKISGHLAHGNVQDQDQEWYNIEIHCFKKEGECEVTRTYLSCRAAFGDVIKLYSFYDPYRLRSWSDTKIVADLGGNIVIIQLGDLIGPNKFTHSMTYKAKAFLDGEEVLGGDWFIQQRR